MKILYTSDTHVHPGHLNLLLKAAASIQPEAVIIGGDVIPDWKGSIAHSIEPHKSWVKYKLIPRIQKFGEEFPEIALLLDLGNDDIAAARPLLEETDGMGFHLIHMRIIKLDGGLVVAGYMKVNPTPFSIKDGEKIDCRDRDGLSDPAVKQMGMVTTTGFEQPYRLDPEQGTIEDDLEELSDVLESPQWMDRPFLFVSHAPPRDTALDQTSSGVHVGSLATRRFIQKWGPTGRLLASLHGHIHESPMETGKICQEIAGVPCFNVGQEGRNLRALLFDSHDIVNSARLILVGSSGEISMAERE